MTSRGGVQRRMPPRPSRGDAPRKGLGRDDLSRHVRRLPGRPLRRGCAAHAHRRGDRGPRRRDRRSWPLGLSLIHISMCIRDSPRAVPLRRERLGIFPRPRADRPQRLRRPRRLRAAGGAVGAGPLRPPGRRRCGAVRVHGDGGRPLPPVERLLRGRRRPGPSLRPSRGRCRPGHRHLGRLRPVAVVGHPADRHEFADAGIRRGRRPAARGPRRPGQSRDVRAGLRPRHRGRRP